VTVIGRRTDRAAIELACGPTLTAVPDPADDIEELLTWNRRFYEAFELRDLDAMSDVWEHSDRVVCTHPGWRTLHGWGSVAASWAALFNNAQRLQFIVTDERVELDGDTAWVTCDENVLDSGASGAVAAINVFSRSKAGTWVMVAHHGSPIMQ
jgi:ketosteroid isomerase-like protein